MRIFKLSAPETVRLLSGHILPRSESNFTHKKRETRDPCLQGRGREGEGIKGFIPLKEVQRKTTGGARGMGGKRREGTSGRGDLAPRSILRGIDAPGELRLLGC